jgi:hypothetical protein
VFSLIPVLSFFLFLVPPRRSFPWLCTLLTALFSLYSLFIPPSFSLLPSVVVPAALAQAVHSQTKLQDLHQSLLCMKTLHPHYRLLICHPVLFRAQALPPSLRLHPTESITTSDRSSRYFRCRDRSHGLLHHNRTTRSRCLTRLSVLQTC